MAANQSKRSLLAIAALGVVFGDIGTSPLYTLKTILAGDHTFALDNASIYGALSLIFWTLLLVVTLKYVLIVMRASNHGEGGIMALISLIRNLYLRSNRWKATLIGIGVLGAALFYGDALITPAISVLSAVEGLETVSSGLSEWVVPLTILILVVLFATQRLGTKFVGGLFGPVMVVWFVVLGGLGIFHISQEPGVLNALNPVWGARFLADHGWIGFITLGAVVLAVTGAEALYADMGHFGRSVIARSWFFLVGPALVLNYFGQGANLLRDPSTIDNPFFYQVSSEWRIPLIILSALATVIASQAVISGTFSMSRQAMRLGYLPLINVQHTSKETEGQIYVPIVNWTLLIAIVVIVLGFRHSANLASAYGLAVTGTFLTTTILIVVIAMHMWKVPKPLILFVGAIFAVIDLAFFAANFTKVHHGGWLPLAVGLVVFLTLMSWQRGQTVLRQIRQTKEGSLQAFIKQTYSDPTVQRVPGTAVFLSANSTTTPLALRYNVKHNHVLHQNVVVLTVETEARPYVPENERVTVEDLRIESGGMVLVTARFGYSERSDVPAALRVAADHGLAIDVDNASYFITRSTVQAGGVGAMNRLLKTIFINVNRNSASPIRHFGIPENQVVSMGSNLVI